MRASGRSRAPATSGPANATGRAVAAVEAEIEQKGRADCRRVGARRADDADGAADARATASAGFPGRSRWFSSPKGSTPATSRTRDTGLGLAAARHRCACPRSMRAGSTPTRACRICSASSRPSARAIFGATSASMTPRRRPDDARARNRRRARPQPQRPAAGARSDRRPIAGTYYMLGYSPQKPFDGSYRTIEVSVRRPDVTVRARRGYLAARPPPRPGQPITRWRRRSGGRTPASHQGRVNAASAPALQRQPAPDPASSGGRGHDAEPRSWASAAAGFPRMSRPSGNTGATAADASARRANGARRAGISTPPARSRKRATRCRQAAAARRRRLGGLRARPGGVRTPALASRRSRPGSACAPPSPTYEPVYFDLADAYLQLGRSSDSLAVLRDAARRWPEDSETHNAVGVVLVSRGAIDDAHRGFDSAIRVAPADASAITTSAARTTFATSAACAPAAPAAPPPRSRSPTGSAEMRSTNYKKCISIGGSFEKDAREALAGLEWGK